jgi:predicted nucleotidyltransferase component of viral defense system
MRGPECSLKVEVSMQEPLLADPVQRPLIHEFPGEPLEATVATYRLEEIAAEKLRAFLQSRQHFRDRGWLKNRPRDLYDLWYLQQQSYHPLDWQEVARLLPDKARAYGLSYREPEDFLDEQVITGIRRDWRGQLGNFVTDLPTFEQCLSTLHALLSEIFG